ncbi:MAG: EamA family transporter [Oscillospiraceae bacterium]|nr:EamA family transporter [Oscillospiraceae bacterium]
MKKVSPLLIVLAGILWGTMGIYVRVLNAHGMYSIQIVFTRAVITAAVMAVVILLTDRARFKVRLKDLWIMVCGGICSILFFNVSYFKAIEVTSLSVACVLMYTSPFFVTVIYAIVFKDKISLRKAAAMVIVFIGCALVSGIASEQVRVTGIGLVYGLCAGIGYALYSIFSRLALNRGYHIFTILLYNFLFAAVGGAFIVDFGEIGSALSTGTAAVVAVTACGFIATVFPYLLYTKGLENVENSKAAVIVAIEPVAATVIGASLYSEKLTVTAVVGIALVIAAIAMLSGKKRNTAHTQNNGN